MDPYELDICTLSKVSKPWENAWGLPVTCFKSSDLFTDSQVYNPNNKVQLDIWVFPKIGVGPPNHPTLIGFSIIFTIHFGGFPPIFGLTPIAPYHQRTSSTICASPPPTQNTHTAKWHGHVLCGQGCQYVQTFSWKTPPNSGACQPWHSLAFLPHQT